MRATGVLTGARLAAVLVCAALGACAAPARPVAVEQGAENTAPVFPRLERLAEAQRRRPITVRPDLAYAPGLDPSAVAPAPTEGDAAARAQAPLAGVIDTLAATALPEPPPAAPAGRVDRRAALGRYAAGREKLLLGDGPGAVTDLLEATRLDGASPETWALLGDAQLQSGSVAEAVASYRTALSRGSDDPRLLELLGRDSMDRGTVQPAAAYFARSLRSPRMAGEPALRAVVHGELCWALEQLGYLRATKEAVDAATARPERSVAPSRFMGEVAALDRRRADLLRLKGDVETRLGEFAGAVDSYQRSMALPALATEDAGPRLAFAAARAGQPARAAVVLLERAMSAASPSRLDLALLGYLSRIAPTGDALDAALREYAALGSPTADRAGRVALVRSAVLQDAASRRVLREHLARYPDDRRAAAALLATVQGHEQATREAVRLVERHAADAAWLASTLVSRFGAAPVIAAADRAAPTWAANLLAARAEMAAGWYGRAAGRFVDVDARGSIEADLAAVQIALECERAELIEPALRRLAQRDSVDRQRACARALRLLQRHGEALDVLRMLLADHPSGPDRVPDLLAAAACAASVGRGPQADAWVREAAALAPGDEDVLGLMLDLYAPTGAMPDTARLGAAVRDLRRLAPDSGVARRLGAQELVRRSQLAAAERELIRLYEDDPDDATTLAVLGAVWERQSRQDPGSYERALDWLGRQLVLRPAAPRLVMARSTLLRRTERAPEAESVLRVALADGGSAEVSRQLEQMIRTLPGRETEADTLALARLDRPARTVEGSVELAELLQRLRRPADAALAVAEGIDPGVTLTQDQSTRVLLLTQRLSQQAVDGLNTDARRGALVLFDFLVARGTKFSPEMHERRLALLGSAPATPLDALFGAAGDAAHDYPALGFAPYARAARALQQAGRMSDALALISRAAAALPKPGIEVFAEWYDATARGGGGADGRRLIEAAERSGQLDPLLARIERVQDLPVELRDHRSEVANHLANRASGLGRTPESREFYELALEFDPAHPWACNNLGYMLVEQGAELARAESLLETAYRQAPQEASIIDSLGWLRYRQGRLDDQKHTDGSESPGAITLLESAALLPAGARNPTILDHLADALWIAGRREEAMARWAAAERAAVSLLAAMRRLEERDLDTEDTLRDRLDAVRAKRRAALEGTEVPVAPRVTVPQE